MFTRVDSGGGDGDYGRAAGPDRSGDSGWNFFFGGTLVAPKTIAATITAEVMSAVGTGNAQFRDGV